MQIVVNGEKLTLHHPILSDALISWGYQLDMPMAVAVNQNVIPNSAYAQTPLKADDRVEILMPMQGG